ncbi:MAG: FAD-binding protein [Deltaproteobacteria bacterium]|nr:FAD-binding protein [Deltaproteobacteria bacterium]
MSGSSCGASNGADGGGRGRADDRLSGGGCLAVGTPLQRARGIEDSVELALDDWVRWGGPGVDREWARFYIEHSLHELYLWAERHGVVWQDLLPQEGNSVARWHRHKDGGLGLMTPLVAAAEARGVHRCLTATVMVDLLLEGGRAVGIKGRAVENGAAYEIRARAVLLTTGGFCGSPAMIRDYAPRLWRRGTKAGGGPGALGFGHRVVEGIGGLLVNIEEVWTYVYATPDYEDPEGQRALVLRGMPGQIWVSPQGRRFHDESHSGGASGTPAVLGLDPPHAWALVDGSMIPEIEVSAPGYRKGRENLWERVHALLERSPHIHCAGSIEELARRAGMAPQVLVETVARWNGYLTQGLGRDPEFGRPLQKCRPLVTPPFYLIKYVPMARKNFGGVRTNLRCQVLDREERVIPGLFAAGELCGQAGGRINGRAGLEGTMLGPSVFSGRVAGAWAAHEAGCGPGFVGRSLQSLDASTGAPLQYEEQSSSAPGEQPE